MASSNNEKLLKTSFYDLHISLGGKMFPFAGYELPVQYEGLGVLKEHLHTRAANSCSLFDVSHMGQIHWHGKDAVKFIEKLVVEYSSLDVTLEHLEDQQLLALQGNGAKDVISKLAPSLDISKLNFMSSTITTIAGISNCRVTRCGYTGEDGFEISVDPKNAVSLAQSILKFNEVKPAGLGSRDSLRLEAGLCLYGNDLTEDINPVEASLIWTLGGPKSRRRLEQGFLGAEHFLEKDGKPKPTKVKRVGISGMKAPARGHTEVYTSDGITKIGEITSGGFGPSYQGPVAIGYINTEYSKDNTDISLLIRGKHVPAKVSKMPFVPTNYYRAL
eukprot:gene19463-25345_t